jgi:hypothetical protein
LERYATINKRNELYEESEWLAAVEFGDTRHKVVLGLIFFSF